MAVIAGRCRISNRGRISNGSTVAPLPPSFLDASFEEIDYVGASLGATQLQTEFVESSIEWLLPQGGLVSDYELDPVATEFEAEPGIYVGLQVDAPTVGTVFVDGDVDLKSYSSVTVQGDPEIELKSFGTNLVSIYSYSLGGTTKDIALLPDDEIVVTRGVFSNQIRRLDATGNPVWVYDWSANWPDGLGLTQGDTCCLFDGNVFAGTNFRIGRFDPQDGSFTTFLDNPWSRDIQTVRPTWDGSGLMTGWQRSNSTAAVNRGVVARYDFDGTLQWSWQPQGTAAGSGYGESVVHISTAPGRVYTLWSALGDVRMFDDASGNLIWTKNLTGGLTAGSAAQPYVMASNGERLVIVAGTGLTQILLMHDLDGNELFRLNASEIGITSSNQSIHSLDIDAFNEVYYAWTGSGTSDGRRFRRIDANGNLVYEFVNAGWGGNPTIRVNENGIVFVGGTSGNILAYAQTR
jgi:hypothetical protein